MVSVQVRRGEVEEGVVTGVLSRGWSGHQPPGKRGSMEGKAFSLWSAYSCCPSVGRGQLDRWFFSVSLGA